MTGFIRKQEIRLAAKLLKWHYDKQKYPIPGEEALGAQAEKLVDEAHRIAKERGKNVVAIVKELIKDIKK